MKRTIIFFFIILGIFFLATSIAMADQTGKVNSKIKWTLTDDGVLTISGTGKMPDYSTADSKRPWEYEEIKEVIIQKGIKELQFCTFSGMESIEKVTIADTVTKIDPWNFTGCKNLKEINLPKNLTAIEGDMFSGCTKLTNISIPEKVTQIQWSAFSGCDNLIEIVLPAKLERLANSSFSNCSSLKKIAIPDKILEIETHTFSYCSYMRKIILPKGLKRIDNGAFSGCYSLTDIYYYGTEEEWNKIQIRDDNEPIYSSTIHYYGTWNMADWEKEEEPITNEQLEMLEWMKQLSNND